MLLLYVLRPFFPNNPIHSLNFRHNSISRRTLKSLDSSLPPHFTTQTTLFPTTPSHQSASSSLTTSWDPSLASKASRSSRFRMRLVPEWSPPRRCCLSPPNVSSRFKVRSRPSRQPYLRSVNACWKTGKGVLAPSNTIRERPVMPECSPEDLELRL